MSEPLVKVDRLVLTGPSGDLVHGVSFDLLPGQVTAVVGPSGSGKSLIGRALIGLLPSGVTLKDGQIHFAGAPVSAYDERAWRSLRGSQIGLIFQEPMTSLNPSMTIGRQLEEGLRLHKGLSRDEARDRIIEMLRAVRFAKPETCLGAYPHEFSGGMRQRIMLAGCMLLRPKLLIADEPTTALDSLNQRDVLDLMTKLCAEAGTACLLITHNLALVARYAAQALVLSDGRIAEAGAARDVLLAPRSAAAKALVDALPRRLALKPPQPSQETLLEVRDLSVVLGGAPSLFRQRQTHLAVNKVTLELGRGEMLALVGASGSGKSTLGRAVLGRLPPSTGSIRFRERDLADFSSAERRDFRLNAQLIFQDPYSSLNPRQRVAAIIAEPLDQERGLTASARDARVEEMIGAVGLTGLGGRFPHALSGGQRQRVAIARALIRRPDFIVADEPVAALDMTIQAQILDLILDLRARFGFACLFITHDLAVVARVADRVAVMEAGSIVETGAVDQILDRPRHPYARALVEASPELALPPA